MIAGVYLVGVALASADFVGWWRHADPTIAGLIIIGASVVAGMGMGCSYIYLNWRLADAEIMGRQSLGATSGSGEDA